MLFAKACLCQYLGTNYSGWQRQKNGKSIQELIESALTIIYKENIQIKGCGRTDAGVHAIGQIFNFTSNYNRSNEAVVNGCNAYLPEDIGILEAQNVSTAFHAGKSIKAKTYLYKIINTKVPSPLYSNRALWIRNPIDMIKLNDILVYFQGTHDFESFCVKKTKKDNTVRRINFAKAEKYGDEINIEINSNGFLHNMVRIIVGTTLKILQNNKDPKDILKILDAKDRRSAGPTVAPYGLYQKEAIYNNNGIPGIKGIPKEFLI